MAGIGSYEKGKAFALKSGNVTSFKMMGSSPLREEEHFLEKKPTGPVSDLNPSKKEKFIEENVTQFTPPVEKKKDLFKSEGEPKSKLETNPLITITPHVSEPVSTLVNKPNPNIKIDTESSESTIKDVLTLPINVYTNPNKAIRTIQNVFSKSKEVISKGKKKIKTILNKTI